MKEWIAFFKSRTFLKHLGIAAASLLLFFWICFWLLDWYTHHGEAIPVPDFAGKKMSQVQNLAEDKNLRFQIVDSIYDPDKPPGVVVDQDPESGFNVKPDRMIYLTLSTNVPPMVSMPNLVDASVRQAASVLESYGFKIGKKNMRPDPCSGCVLAQLMNGKEVKPGTRIPKGSVIDLVVGKGQGSDYVPVPKVIGMTLDEARSEIIGANLSVGAIICEGCKTSRDSASAKVYQQNPGASAENLVNSGSSVDLYLTTKEIKKPE